MRNPFRRKDFTPEDLWAMKQYLARPGRYYGDGGTIHGTTYLDIRLEHGTVSEVWFRCQQLPFMVHDDEGAEYSEFGGVKLTGVEVIP